MIENSKCAKSEPATKSWSRKRRNPQDRSKLTRNSQVQIRLTGEEVFALKAAAKENDMTLADFVMSGIHQRRRIVVPGAAEIRAELVSVGNNLNQALKLAHIQQKVDAKSMEMAISQVKTVLEKLQDWLTMWDVYLAYKKEKGDM